MTAARARSDATDLTGPDPLRACSQLVASRDPETVAVAHSYHWSGRASRQYADAERSSVGVAEIKD